MTNEQRDKLLLAMFEKIESMSIKIECLDQKTETYHQEALRNHQTVLQELERQRMNVAKMEHNLTEQIKALYDLSDLQNDKFKEQDKTIKEIQNTLDWHNRRILKLETAN